MIDLDFNTGKLHAVAKRIGPDRRREYRLLGLVLLLSLLPVTLLLVFWPLLGICLILFSAYFQVLATFARSTSTLTSHHIRFLLAGSNPIGVTGASSLVFGAVDAIVDWKEDAGTRSTHPCRYWMLLVFKFAMTPVGLVLMGMEYFWDIVLLRRSGIVPHKWNELFSLAWYHNFVCPEKSNDIFYADMAFARFKNDAQLYQWNRLRALVFEFEHYRIDFENGFGVPETNIFWQDDLTAYQSLKRLQVEAIEATIAAHFLVRPKMLPIPPKIGSRLIRNARPLEHYLKIRSTHPRVPVEPWEQALTQIWQTESRSYDAWHVLRLLDANQGVVTSRESHYLSDKLLASMAESGILTPVDRELGSYAFTPQFRTALTAILKEFFVCIRNSRRLEHTQRILPTALEFDRQMYVPRAIHDSL